MYITKTDKSEQKMTKRLLNEKKWNGLENKTKSNSKGIKKYENI